MQQNISLVFRGELVSIAFLLVVFRFFFLDHTVLRPLSPIVVAFLPYSLSVPHHLNCLLIVQPGPFELIMQPSSLPSSFSLQFCWAFMFFSPMLTFILHVWPVAKQIQYPVFDLVHNCYQSTFPWTFWFAYCVLPGHSQLKSNNAFEVHPASWHLLLSESRTCKYNNADLLTMYMYPVFAFWLLYWHFWLQTCKNTACYPNSPPCFKCAILLDVTH